MTNWKNIFTGAVAVTLIAVPVTAVIAQGPTTAAIHGKVTNIAGLPMTTKVEFTTDLSEPKDAKFTIIKDTDAAGMYSATDVKPGHYLIYVVEQGKYVDRMEVTVKAGEDKTVDFDMTRADYVKGLTEEEKAAVEKYKASLKSSSVITNLNATLTAVRADLKTATPNFDKDVADMTQATTQKPDEGVLWGTLGDALLASADHQAAEDRKAGKSPMSDTEVLKKYEDAVGAYQKAIDTNMASKKPRPEDAATVYNQMGIAQARAGKVQEAQTAYEAAAKLVPANAGMYYGNEAAVLFNASQTNSALGEGALAAANKAIAADPNRPDPYYVKGQILLQKATLDPKTQQFVAPPGCIESYQKYLELAPDGKYAGQVTDVLTGLGQKVQTKYKAGKK
jgi:tetratricopeptide (TPR) repeat protein